MCTLNESARGFTIMVGGQSKSISRQIVFFSDVPDLEIYTDVSLSCWGACCNEVRTRGSWTLADTRKHINELELLGALYAIKAFAAHTTRRFGYSYTTTR